MRNLLLLFLYLPVFSQTNAYPTDYFRLPLDIPVQLSGNFGELRSNHFHTGYDFRTQQKEGFAVHAVADGYISRIKISSYGYGKAIYIDHPNGYTTLYGHLQSGYGAIEAYIKAEQYRQQSYEIEVFPKPGELPVLKGDTIALSGNTGGSEGPHLHFEFRDTKTEKIINPAFFGFNLKDTRKPNIASVVAYPIGEGSSVNQSTKPTILGLSLQKDGSYIAQKVNAHGQVGFGLITTDQDDVSWANNGTFKVQGFLNGVPAFGYQFEQLAFDEGRYLNALLDYPRYRRTQQRVQRLFMTSPYPLSIINTNADNGIVTVKPDLSELYRIEASDYYNNKTVVNIPIDYTDVQVTNNEPVVYTSYFVRAKTDTAFEKDGMSVFFPANTFYEDFPLNFDVRDGVMTVQDDNTPVHSNFSVSVNAAMEPLADKTFIASLSGKRLQYNATKYKNGVFTAWTRNLGGFTLAKDTVAPRISLVGKSVEGKWISSQKSISFTISDNLSGLKSYNGYLNGQWVLFEYDHKKNRITHVFDPQYVKDGENELKISVSDNVGNSAIFETHFFRSQK